MSATARSSATPASPPASRARWRPRLRARSLDRLRGVAIGLWAGLALVYLFIPVFVVIAFSFNAPTGRFNITWEGFTLEHWKHPFAVEGLGEALSTSLQVAALSTVFSVVLGTLLALGLVRHGFRGRGLADFFVFLPLATPEVVLGAALLGLFLTMSVVTGFTTIVIAHTMFNIAFVVITVKARLAGMDEHLEEAAMDLGANEWTTLRKVTLPLIAPGVAAAALLAFALSFDDFVITNFNAGTTVTFPLYVWGAARQGVPPQVNVLATMLLLITVTLMVVNVLVQRALARRDAPPAPSGA